MSIDSLCLRLPVIENGRMLFYVLSARHCIAWGRLLANPRGRWHDRWRVERARILTVLIHRRYIKSMRLIKHPTTNKVIGRVVRDTFISHRKPYHFFIRYHGFGISDSVLRDLDRSGVRWIVIIYEGTRGTTQHKCPITAYLDSPQTYHDGPSDLQRFVPLDAMQTIRVGEPECSRKTCDQLPLPM